MTIFVTSFGVPGVSKRVTKSVLVPDKICHHGLECWIVVVGVGMTTEPNRLTRGVGDENCHLPRHGLEPWRIEPSAIERGEGGAPSWVYFVQEGHDGPIKIGSSSAPWRRRTALQTGAARRLYMRRLVPGGVKVEAHYHRIFAHLRIKGGEWFRCEGDLAGYLDPDFDLE